MVCLSVTIVSPAKTAEPIAMLFGFGPWVVPRNHVLNGSPDPRYEGPVLRGKGRPVVKYVTFCRQLRKNGYRDTVGVWTRVGPKKHVLDEGADLRHLANATEPSMCGGNKAIFVKLL